MPLDLRNEKGKRSRVLSYKATSSDSRIPSKEPRNALGSKLTATSGGDDDNDEVASSKRPRLLEDEDVSPPLVRKHNLSLISSFTDKYEFLHPAYPCCVATAPLSRQHTLSSTSIDETMGGDSSKAAEPTGVKAAEGSKSSLRVNSITRLASEFSTEVEAAALRSKEAETATASETEGLLKIYADRVLCSTSADGGSSPIITADLMVWEYFPSLWAAYVYWSAHQSLKSMKERKKKRRRQQQRGFGSNSAESDEVAAREDELLARWSTAEIARVCGRRLLPYVDEPASMMSCSESVRVAMKRLSNEIWDLYKQMEIRDMEETETGRDRERRMCVLELMHRDKFQRNPDLRKLLVQETRGMTLVYDDEKCASRFLAKVNFGGENIIGRILTCVRNDINNGRDTFRWIVQMFPVERNLVMGLHFKVMEYERNEENEKIWVRDYSVEEMEDRRNYGYGIGMCAELWRRFPQIENEESHETVKNETKSLFVCFGKNEENEIVCSNPSVSRNHAVLIPITHKRLCMVDLGSVHGTYFNGSENPSALKYRLTPFVPFPVLKGDVFSFALSTRAYAIEIDLASRMAALRKREMQLLAELSQASICILSGKKGGESECERGRDLERHQNAEFERAAYSKGSGGSGDWRGEGGRGRYDKWRWEDDNSRRNYERFRRNSSLESDKKDDRRDGDQVGNRDDGRGYRRDEGGRRREEDGGRRGRDNNMGGERRQGMMRRERETSLRGDSRFGGDMRRSNTDRGEQLVSRPPPLETLKGPLDLIISNIPRQVTDADFIDLLALNGLDDGSEVVEFRRQQQSAQFRRGNAALVRFKDQVIKFKAKDKLSDRFFRGLHLLVE